MSTEQNELIDRVNHRPQIDAAEPVSASPSVMDGSCLLFRLTASDSDGDALSYRWIQDGRVVAQTAEYNYCPGLEQVGTHSISGEVSDGALSSLRNWQVDVTPSALTIVHTPVTGGFENTAIVVTAIVTGPQLPIVATLYYRTSGTAEDIELPMSLTTGHTYEALIPLEAVTVAGLDYYIDATDSNATVMHPASGTHHITIARCHTLALGHTGDGAHPVSSPQTNCSNGRYGAGTVIQLTAAPAAGWQITGWSGTADDASTAQTNQLTMPDSPRTVIVHYGPRLEPHMTYTSGQAAFTWTHTIAEITKYEALRNTTPYFQPGDPETTKQEIAALELGAAMSHHDSGTTGAQFYFLRGVDSLLVRSGRHRAISVSSIFRSLDRLAPARQIQRPVHRQPTQRQASRLTQPSPGPAATPVPTPR